MKTCNTCHENKPVSDFYKNNRRADRLDSKCKACHTAEKKARYWKDPEAKRARNREAARKYREQKQQYWRWYENQLPGGRTEYFRRANLKRNYGLEYDDFMALVEAQNGTCAICKQRPKEDSIGRMWQVDHDHVTGKVRGLLCKHCNWGLGHFNDSIEKLQSAIDYLSLSTAP